MKKVLILLINIYQAVFSSFVHQLTGTKNACRFSPTCSQYAKISIQKKGIAVGAYLSVLRILKCQPFYKMTA